MGGHLEALQWVRAQGCPWDRYACTTAIKNGHLDALRWMMDHGSVWPADAADTAIKFGYMHILEWMQTRHDIWDNSYIYICQAAAEEGHLGVL